MKAKTNPGRESFTEEDLLNLQRKVQELEDQVSLKKETTNLEKDEGLFRLYLLTALNRIAKALEDSLKGSEEDEQ